MGDAKQSTQDFGAVKARLEEIAQIVGNDDVPLDDALDLFEEAVALGMQVSDLLEVGALADIESAEQAVDETPATDQPDPSAS